MTHHNQTKELTTWFLKSQVEDEKIQEIKRNIMEEKSLGFS
jgi:hypothetical protein